MVPLRTSPVRARASQTNSAIDSRARLQSVQVARQRGSKTDDPRRRAARAGLARRQARAPSRPSRRPGGRTGGRRARSGRRDGGALRSGERDQADDGASPSLRSGHRSGGRRSGSSWPRRGARRARALPLELFLAHRAGLDAHRTLYAPLARGPGAVDVATALREAADARRLDAPGRRPAEGFAPLYSDLGYVLAGVALARAVGARDAGEAIARLVLEPLGLALSAGTVRELAARGVIGPFAPDRDGGVAGRRRGRRGPRRERLGADGPGRLGPRRDLRDARRRADLRRGGAQSSWSGRSGSSGSSASVPAARSARASTARAPTGLERGRARWGRAASVTSASPGTSLWIDPGRARRRRPCSRTASVPSRGHPAIRAAPAWAHDALFARAGHTESV